MEQKIMKNSIEKVITTVKRTSLIKHLIVIVTISFCTNSSKALTNEEWAHILRTIAVVDNEGRLGNGFFIATNLLITSYQVIKDDSLEQFSSPNADANQTVNGEIKNTLVRIASIAKEDVGQVLAIDPQNDLAVIKTAESHYLPIIIGNELDMLRGPNALALFQDYNTISKTQFSLTSYRPQGFIGAPIGNKLFHTTIPVLPNTNGAPIFSKKGWKVIGMVSGQSIRIRPNTPHEYNQYGDFISYTFAVSINRIRAFIERYRDLLERESGADLSYIYSESSVNDTLDMYIRTPEDQFRLSLVYRHGQGGVPKDDKKAFELLEQASRQGHTEAQYQRAKMHYFGIGAEQNYQKAFYWANKAANGGHIKAKMLVGHMHGNGQGTPRDINVAREWLQRGINQENRVFRLKECAY